MYNIIKLHSMFHRLINFSIFTLDVGLIPSQPHVFEAATNHYNCNVILFLYLVF